MFLFHHNSYLSQRAVIVGVLSLLIGSLLNSSVEGQRLSREEALREAGRIATDAERNIVEAQQKVRNGGDRKLIVEAERDATESFVKAIELWREAGDDRRLIAAVEELTRIYFIIGDYDRLVERLKQEAHYWLKRGDYYQQAWTLFTLGTRQSQMQRSSAAIETYQRVIEMSGSGQFYNLGANTLSRLASEYTRVGRDKEAESSRARANEWSALKDQTPSKPLPPSAPAIIPAQWIDLPSAPLGAEYRVVGGVNQAVLVNRSLKVVNMISIGCVSLENNNKVRVLRSLTGSAISHGGIGQGLYFMPFAILNGPMNQWTDEKMACEGVAKMSLIEAGFEDRTGWKADGSDWVVR